MTVQDEGQSWKYGFQWWLQRYGKLPERYAWAARGFGGQKLRVVPESELITVFTGWDGLPGAEEPRHDELEPVLGAVDKQYSFSAPPKYNRHTLVAPPSLPAPQQDAASTNDHSCA